MSTTEFKRGDALKGAYRVITDVHATMLQCTNLLINAQGQHGEPISNYTWMLSGTALGSLDRLKDSIGRDLDDIGMPRRRTLPVAPPRQIPPLDSVALTTGVVKVNEMTLEQAREALQVLHQENLQLRFQLGEWQ